MSTKLNQQRQLVRGGASRCLSLVSLLLCAPRIGWRGLPPSPSFPLNLNTPVPFPHPTRTRGEGTWCGMCIYSFPTRFCFKCFPHYNSRRIAEWLRCLTRTRQSGDDRSRVHVRCKRGSLHPLYYPLHARTAGDKAARLLQRKPCATLAWGLWADRVVMMGFAAYSPRLGFSRSLPSECHCC